MKTPKCSFLETCPMRRSPTFNEEICNQISKNMDEMQKSEKQEEGGEGRRGYQFASVIAIRV
jgi:hypothetical protein